MIGKIVEQRQRRSWCSRRACCSAFRAAMCTRCARRRAGDAGLHEGRVLHGEARAASPGDKADKHALLADELIKFRDYDHALEHLQKAKELGNSLDAARIDRMLPASRSTRSGQGARSARPDPGRRSRNTLLDYEKGRS
jgi:hypothetical protein